MRRLYVNSGTRIFLEDSRTARELNSVFKESEVVIKSNDMFLCREDRCVKLPNEDISVNKDEEGYFFDL